MAEKCYWRAGESFLGMQGHMPEPALKSTKAGVLAQIWALTTASTGSAMARVIDGGTNYALRCSILQGEALRLV